MFPDLIPAFPVLRFRCLMPSTLKQLACQKAEASRFCIDYINRILPSITQRLIFLRLSPAVVVCYPTATLKPHSRTADSACALVLETNGPKDETQLSAARIVQY